jgi:trigger factor
MQVVETKTDELTREFRVALPLADIEQKIDERLGELSRTVKIQGFRPGKVPMTLLRKRYGNALKSEAIEQAINESSAQVMQERGLKPAASPTFDLATDGADDAIEFTMAVEVLPEIPALDAASIALERLRAEVDEATVDQTLERLAKSARAMETVEDGRSAREGDVVLIDIAEAGKAASGDANAPASQTPTLPVEIGAEPTPLATELIGLAVGDAKRITLPLARTEAEPEAENEADTTEPASIEYDVVVKEIRVPQPQPIDDALAQRYGVENVEALRQRVRDEHANELKTASRMLMKRALLDTLNEKFAFSLPKSLVEQEFRAVAQQLYGNAVPSGQAHDHDHDHAHAHDHDHEHCDNPDHDHDHDHADAVAGAPELTDDQRAECQALAERRVRLGLVLADVGRANEVKVLAEDLNKAILAEAQKYPGQHREVIEFFRTNKRAQDALSAPILEDKVVDFIIEMASVSDREVSVDELMKAVGSDDDD